MNNIQKNFKQKAKLGLRLAIGGMVDPYAGMDAAEVAQYTNDPDALNKASTAKWGREEQQRQLSHPGQSFLNPVAQPTQNPLDGVNSKLDTLLGGSNYTQPIGGTTFEQDLHARDGRIRGLRDSLRLADGGIVGSDGLTDAQRAKLSGARESLGVSTTAPQPQPAPVPAPVQAPQPTAKPQGMFGGLRQALDPERRMRGAGLQTGGIVRGKGGPTDDAVPMTVAGRDVNLSNQEAVLPAKTVQALGGPEAVEELIEKTNGKPPSKEGLRAGGNYGGGTVNINGRIIELADDTPRLAPPQPGTAVATRPVINAGSGAGPQYINPEGSIPGESTRVPNGPPATPQPTLARGAPPPPPPRTDLPFRAGQMAGKGVDWLKNNKGKVLGAAADAVALYNANNVGTEHDDFYNSNEVPTLEKAKQFGRDITHTGLPLVTGALGAGIGTVASPTLIANPVTGGLAGAGAGMAIASTVDKEGDAYKRFVASRQKPTAQTPQTQSVDEEALREASMAGLGAGTPQRDKSMAYMRSQGVDTSAFRDPVNDVTTVNGNGPEKQRGGAVNIINTANGPVYTGRDGKGQLVVTSGLDRSDAEQAAAKSGYEQAVAQAQKDKDYLRTMQRDRYVRDTGADITDPNVVVAARENLGRMDKEDAATALAAQHKEEMGLRKGALNLQGQALQQADRHFNETQSTARAVAAAQQGEKRMKDVDDLLGAEDFGDKSKNARWKDFARANFVGGVGEDGKPTKGLEGLDANQARNQLPILKAKFEMNERAQAGALDKTTIKDISGGTKRDVTLKDIDWNAWGMPDLTDSGDHRRMSVEEYLHRKLDPRYGSQLYIDPKGNRYRVGDVRGKAASLGSGDVDELLAKK